MVLYHSSQESYFYDRKVMSDQTKPQKKKPEKKTGRAYLGRKILRALSATAGALDALGNFTYEPYSYLYASLGHNHSKRAISNTINDLVKKGLVEGSEERGLRITSVGTDVKDALYRRRRENWDGKWRVVFFDVPEAKRRVRDDLRFELKKLGFGLWQRSAWVTPFDIAEELSSYLQKQNLDEVVQIVVGERFGQLRDREFAARVWPLLGDVNERYKRLLGAWKKEVGGESTAEERLEAAATLHNRYLDILATDPQLPSELLPKDWVGHDAHKLFKKLKATLTGGKPL